MINYTPFGHSNWQTIVSDIKKFGAAGMKTAVVSTINGDANVDPLRIVPRPDVDPCRNAGSNVAVDEPPQVVSQWRIGDGDVVRHGV